MRERPDVPQPDAPHAAFTEWTDAAKQRRAADLEETERARRKIWWGGLWRIMVVEWAAIALLGWSFHTTSSTAGWIAFWSALGLGDGGFLVLFVITVRRVEQVRPW